MGINILNTIIAAPIDAERAIGASIMLGIFLIVIIGFLIHGFKEVIKAFTYDSWQDWALSLLIIILIVVCIFGVYKLADEINYQRSRTETLIYATISDDVSWTEVNSKYEFVRQDGQIFVLREKPEIEEK